MKRAAAATVGLALVVGWQLGCESEAPFQADAETALTLCSEPRPQMCTRDYRPVCGSRKDGTTHTYGNGCTACADVEVVGHRPGACEDD